MNLDVLETLVAASLVLLLGRKIVDSSNWLKTYSIPEPVVGGLLVALLLLTLRKFGDVQVHFDTSLQQPLMLAFFATIGLSANIASLRAGGRTLMVFLAAVVGLLIIQNLIGVGMVHMLGLDPLIGLLGGSITLSGGHGTGGAWGQVFSEQYGLMTATEIAMACATFGLIFGGLIGGPVARYLIKKVKHPLPTIQEETVSDGHGENATSIQTSAMTATLSPASGREGQNESLRDFHVKEDSPLIFEQPQALQPITARAFIEALALIAVSLTVGSIIGKQITGTVFALPTFVCVLFVGVVLSNGLSLLADYKIFERVILLLGDISLSLFLAMALMSLKLWDLASLALPVLLILVVQTVVMGAYAIFVTFRIMGSNYDAAILSAGHCGFGLGATPTAIANMQAITNRFGPSHVAFLVVPMVGAFFIDIANAIVIKLFLALPIYSLSN